MEQESGAPSGDGRAFYGRRKGKRLRDAQENAVERLLPALRLAPEGPVTDLPARTWLEIGFGGGEHLAFQARSNPEVRFVGCEPFVNGIAKLLRVVEAERLDNVRLWDRDAVELLPRLPAASIERAFLLFPDPWPKRRQRKRRFVGDETLAALARILKPSGEFRFATDIDDYAGWTLARVARSAAFRWTATRALDWDTPWPDWPGTRYEAKARAEGRRSSYLTFERV